MPGSPGELYGVSMNTERQRLIRATFDAASALPPESQINFVRSRAGTDTALAEAVLRLLRAARIGEDFLAKPALAADAAPTLHGTRLGNYKIVREIGSGGMGFVYLAVRDDEIFRRTAALKIIRPGLNSPQTVERFRRERQILAQLDHPNIARILDGGATPNGLPYFVMDYVEGRPIDVFANERKASLDQRLNLFRQLCSAIGYLHENRIIHRDLKPSNILVTAKGAVKLLDFGIAKLLDAESDALVKTGPIFTAGYASPEQVSAQPTSTASDIYSLGAVLYELLTGRRPHHAPGRSISDTIAAITRENVQPPSSTIGKTDGPQSAETPVQMRKRLRGDLDAILLKALRREPEQRYASVADLAKDIERFQAKLPVAARNGTALYLVSSFVRRRRTALATGLALAAALTWGGWEDWELHSLRAAMDRDLAERLALAATATAASQRPGDEAQLDRFLKQVGANYKTTFPKLLENPLASRNDNQRLVDRDLTWLGQVQSLAAQKPVLSHDLGRAYLDIAEVQWNESGPSLEDIPGSTATCNRLVALLKQAPTGNSGSAENFALDRDLSQQVNALEGAQR